MKKIIIFILCSLLYIDCSYSSDKNNGKYNLIEAVKNNDVKLVRQFYNRKYVNIRDKYKNVALSYAIYNENYEIIKFLLDNGANPMLVDSTKRPAFCSARNSYDYKIRNIFENYKYNYDDCGAALVYNAALNKGNGGSSLLNWKVGLLGVATIGGAVALLSVGGSGGGSNGGDSDIDTDYDKVGEVNSAVLDRILNGLNTDTIKYYSGYNFSGSIGSTTYSNFNDYNKIRLAYAWARGYDGRVSSSSFLSATNGTPYYFSSATGSSSYTVGTSVKVAVIDEGVSSTNNYIGNNIVSSTSGINPNQLYDYYLNNCLGDSSLCTVKAYNLSDDNDFITKYLKCSNSFGTLTCGIYNNSEKTDLLYSFTLTADNTNPVNADSLHGTLVSGIIVSNPYNTGSSYYGPSGIAPQASVIPYVISMSYNFTEGGQDYSLGSFSNYSYIGRTFEAAGFSGAVAINNSWGSNNYANSIINEVALTSYFGTDFLNSIKNTINNYDSIFVWASGNDGNSQPSAESAIPLYLTDGSGRLLFYDYNTQSYKNFITVVAYDTDADLLASWSNQCGVARNYCLTAPGASLITTYGDSDGLAVVDGTSFAAPIVTGAIAVLKSAYPYLNGADISRLLFLTARDLGATGVDAVYGWGMLDLERATRPYGATIVPIDLTIGSSSYSLPSTIIKTGSLFSDTIKKADLSFIMLDSFNRAYPLSLNDYVLTNKNRLNTIDIVNNFGEGGLKSLKLNKTMNLYYNEYNNDLNIANKELELSYNSNSADSGNYGFNIYYGNNPYNAFINDKIDLYSNYSLINSYNYNVINPYFRNDSKNNFGFNNLILLNKKTILNFGILYQNYTTNYDNKFNNEEENLGSAYAIMNGLEYKFNDNIKTKVEFSLINEYDTLFGTKTDGAFNIGNNNITYLLSLQNNLNLFDNKVSLFGKANFGYTKVNTNYNSSLIKDISNIYTNSFAFGINYNLDSKTKNEKDNISLLISQPIKIESGNMKLSLPIARDYYGNIYYSNHDLNLENEREIDLQLSYNHKINNDKSLSFGFIFRDADLNENIILLKYKKAINF